MAHGGKRDGSSCCLDSLHAAGRNSLPKVMVGGSNPARGPYALCIIDTLRSRGGVLHRSPVLRPQPLGFARIFVQRCDEQSGKGGGVPPRSFVIRGSRIVWIRSDLRVKLTGIRFEFSIRQIIKSTDRDAQQHIIISRARQVAHAWR